MGTVKNYGTGYRGYQADDILGNYFQSKQSAQMADVDLLHVSKTGKDKLESTLDGLLDEKSSAEGERWINNFDFKGALEGIGSVITAFKTPTTSNPSNTQQNPPQQVIIQAPPAKDKDGLSGGAIAGIVIGGLAVVGLLVFLIVRK